MKHIKVIIILLLLPLFILQGQNKNIKCGVYFNNFSNYMRANAYVYLKPDSTFISNFWMDVGGWQSEIPGTWKVQKDTLKLKSYFQNEKLIQNVFKIEENFADTINGTELEFFDKNGNPQQEFCFSKNHIKIFIEDNDIEHPIQFKDIFKEDSKTHNVTEIRTIFCLNESYSKLAGKKISMQLNNITYNFIFPETKTNKLNLWIDDEELQERFFKRVLNEKYFIKDDTSLIHYNSEYSSCYILSNWETNKSYNVSSKNKKYLLSVKPKHYYGYEGESIVYKLNADSAKTFLYKIYNYLPNAEILDDGRTIIGKNWNGEVDRNFKDTILYFYKDGILNKAYSVDNLLISKNTISIRNGFYLWQAYLSSINQGADLKRNEYVLVMNDNNVQVIDLNTFSIKNTFMDSLAISNEYEAFNKDQNERNIRLLRKGYKLYKSTSYFRDFETDFTVKNCKLITDNKGYHLSDVNNYFEVEFIPRKKYPVNMSLVLDFPVENFDSVAVCNFNVEKFIKAMDETAEFLNNNKGLFNSNNVTIPHFYVVYNVSGDWEYWENNDIVLFKNIMSRNGYDFNRNDLFLSICDRWDRVGNMDIKHLIFIHPSGSNTFILYKDDYKIKEWYDEYLKIKNTICSKTYYDVIIDYALAGYAILDIHGNIKFIYAPDRKTGKNNR